MNIDIDNIDAHNERVRFQSLRAIHPQNLGVIATCAARGLGERRMSQAIAATAEEFSADPFVCLAAFGFLVDDGIVVDALNQNWGIVRLPDNNEVRAAWRLAQLTYGGPGRSQVSVRGTRSRRIAAVVGRHARRN